MIDSGPGLSVPGLTTARLDWEMGWEAGVKEKSAWIPTGTPLQGCAGAGVHHAVSETSRVLLPKGGTKITGSSRKTVGCPTRGGAAGMGGAERQG